MNTNGINRLFKEAGKIAKKIDYAKIARAGKEIAVGIGEVAQKVPWMQIAKTMGLIGAGYGLKAILDQVQISKLKSACEGLQTENEKLRETVKTLNDSVCRMKKKIEALKASNFVEKAKSTSELKSCIIYQYATKEYIEIAIKKASGGTLSFEERKYSSIFEKVLNADIIAEDAKYIEEYVLPKYKNKIDNLIEFDCTCLLEKLNA